MPRIKSHRREAEEPLVTFGHDRIVFEWDKPDGTVGEVSFVVSATGHLSFEGVPVGYDPEEPGAIWVDENGFVRASAGPQDPP